VASFVSWRTVSPRHSASQSPLKCHTQVAEAQDARPLPFLSLSKPAITTS